MGDKKKHELNESPKWPHWPSVAIPEQVRWSWFGKIVLAYGFCMVFIGGPYAVVGFILCYFGYFGR
jgi:hypothetical protein